MFQKVGLRHIGKQVRPLCDPILDWLFIFIPYWTFPVGCIALWTTGRREAAGRQESEHDGPSRSGRGELHHATSLDEIFMRRPPPPAIQGLLFLSGLCHRGNRGKLCGNEIPRQIGTWQSGCLINEMGEASLTHLGRSR